MKQYERITIHFPGERRRIQWGYEVTEGTYAGIPVVSYIQVKRDGDSVKDNGTVIQIVQRDMVEEREPATMNLLYAMLETSKHKI